jgi:hypothetical protein
MVEKGFDFWSKLLYQLAMTSVIFNYQMITDNYEKIG